MKINSIKLLILAGMLCSCTYDEPKSSPPFFNPPKQEDEDILSSLKMVQQEVLYRFNQHKPIGPEYISGQPFGVGLWNVGAINQEEYFVEVEAIGKEACQQLSKAMEKAIIVLINDDENGKCENNSTIRWIFESKI